MKYVYDEAYTEKGWFDSTAYIEGWLNDGLAQSPPPPSGDGKIHVKVGGAWVLATPYVKVAGAWIAAKAYTKQAGAWGATPY